FRSGCSGPGGRWSPCRSGCVRWCPPRWSALRPRFPGMPGPTVLVIDDEPQIRRVVRNAFKGLSERVLEAGTGNQGIDLAAAQRPELIVLDLALPDLPGERVCREIRQWSAAPILVLSARHSDEEKVRLLDTGADDYVTKPFSPSEFQARARALLRRSQGMGK